MEGFQSALCLRCELSDERPILNGVILTHGRSDGDATRVNNNDAFDSLVSVYTVDGLLYFLGLQGEVSYNKSLAYHFNFEI